MKKEKILLAVLMIVLVPTMVLASSNIREDIKLALGDLGIEQQLDSHDKRLDLLETRANALISDVTGESEAVLVMKTALELNRTVSMGKTTCYPQENMCIAREQ